AECSQRAIQRDVAQADGLKVGESRPHVFDERLRNLLSPFGKLQSVQERDGIANFQVAHVGEGLVADASGECFGTKTRAAAGRAGAILAPTAEDHTQMHFVFAALQPAEEAVETAEVSFFYAFDNEAAMFFSKFGEGNIDGQVVVVGEGEQFVSFVSVSWC